MKNNIIVVGSSNTDLVIHTDRLPLPGETVLGGTFFMNPGGKGANQAVAAARLGGRITFVAKTGTDLFGRQSVKGFEMEGIDTSFVVKDDQHPSGIALITVDKKAQNTISVASGANGALMPEDVDRITNTIDASSILLLQLEIPMATVEHIVSLAAQRNARIILNPAPALPLNRSLLEQVHILTPNESEAAALTGINVVDSTSAGAAARMLNDMGVKTVIVTLGEKGALISEGGTLTVIQAPTVDAVDTTAAGDVFNGALAVALAEENDLPAAVSFACRAASVSVTRMGAQSSAPTRNEVDMIIAKTTNL